MVWEAGKHDIVFYADNGCIPGQNPIWVQKTLATLVPIFDRFGLQKTLGNTKAMVCIPRFVWEKQVEDTHKRWVMGKGDMFRNRKRTQVSCDECGG